MPELQALCFGGDSEDSGKERHFLLAVCMGRAESMWGRGGQLPWRDDHEPESQVLQERREGQRAGDLAQDLGSKLAVALFGLQQNFSRVRDAGSLAGITADLLVTARSVYTSGQG